MQSSQTTHDLCQEDDEYNGHKPVKQVRSHDIDDQNQQQRQHTPFRKNRSLSSGFRHSIRNLTSCALVRRKPGRTTDQNDHSLSITEANTTFENDHHQSSKALLIPSKPVSLSPSHKKYNRIVEPSSQSSADDIPPAIPSRKPLKKKTSDHMPSTKSNTSEFNSSSPMQSTTGDDISLSNSCRLSNKEISTSLANLMGTASDTVPINNTTQIPTHESRPRKHSVLSLLQHISSTPAATIDRLGLFESLSNAGATGMVESQSPQRSFFTGNNLSPNASPSSYTKPTNDYTWCYENSASIPTNSGNGFDECLPRLEIDDKPLIYRQQFEPTEHFNWYGISDVYGPVIISFKYSNDQDKQRYIMAIVRTRQRTSIESLLDASSSLSSLDILRRICDQCAITDMEYFDPVLCDGTHDLLIKYDESHVSTKHKFGIIYQRENQFTEEDIFSNETHSVAMEKFLDLIGDRVKLKDFQGFRGGLDVKSDQTGTESIYEQFYNHEIMFHISTLLPHSKIERQQLERKRHIGNDIIAIIFQETETLFNPEWIASQFLHVYLVITPLDSHGTRFKVSVIHRDSVPSFGPIINYSNTFHCDNIFKQWILTKLINAEIASYRSNTFQKYHERTKINLFENLYRTLHDSNRPFMNFILNHSQYKHECEIEQQREDVQIYPATKFYDRHTDNSLLGSVRRRLISPKLRTQNSPPIPPTTYMILTSPTNNTNDSKAKTRSMTMDLKRSASKESMTSTGNHHTKVTSIFSSSKNYSLREKLTNNRSQLEPENIDSSSGSRLTSKFLSPVTCPSTPSYGINSNGDSYLLTTAFDFSKLSTDDTDHDNHNQLLIDNLQSSSKEDLIKCVIALQQQHTTKLAQMDQIHSKAMKQLEMQLLQQPHHTMDEES